MRHSNLVQSYYSKQQRSYHGRLNKIALAFLAFAASQMKIINVVDKPFIQLRRLKQAYYQITGLIFPKLYIHALFRYNSQYTLSYTFTPKPLSESEEYVGNNPVLYLLEEAYHDYTNTEVTPFKMGFGQKLYGIKTGFDYMVPKFKNYKYLEKVHERATYQGMAVEQGSKYANFYVQLGYTGVKNTKRDIQVLQYNAIKKVSFLLKKQCYKKLTSEQQAQFMRLWQILHVERKLVPITKFTSLFLNRIPVEKQFKVVSGLIRKI